MDKLEGVRVRVIPVRRGSRNVVDLRRGQKFRVPGTDDFVLLPSWPEEADLIGGYFAQGAPREGDVAFDVGAYCGEISIALARKVGPNGKVFSFEPDSHSRDYLDRNVATACLKNVHVVGKGMWSETTTLSFAEEGNLGSCLVEPGSAAAGVTQVPVLSFEEACRLAGVVPDFVKMDIEGAEVEAIEGSLDFISKHSIRFAIASYHDRNGKPTSVLLEPLFRKAGYEVLTGHPEHQTTWAWKK